MEESCWKILGIEKTKDKLVIKKAFAKLAHTISPEDDPDGYRRIHDAYKQAISYASGQSGAAFFRAARPDYKIPTKNGTDFGIKIQDAKKDPLIQSGFAEKPEEEKLKEKAEKKPEEETPNEEKPDFDFSSVIPEEKEFSDEVEYDLERIVHFKEQNGIDTKENVQRWHEETRKQHATELFELYKSLYENSGDVGVWDVFFEEPLVDNLMIDGEYRKQLRLAYEEDTEAGECIHEHCDRVEKSIEKKLNMGAKDLQLRIKESRDRAAVKWLLSTLSTAISTYVIILFSVMLARVDRAIFPGLLLIGSEGVVYCFMRFYDVLSLERPSDSFLNIFDAGVHPLTFCSFLLVLMNLGYWVFSIVRIREYTGTNIIFMVAGGILGGVAAAIMIIYNKRLRKARR
ncbi:MAG: J domain-containing protein [Clostridiales bacterium]|nr:J domain-containing protein [Clostridiales bacterium]